MGGWCLLFTNITSVCFFIDVEEEEEMTPPPTPPATPPPQIDMVLSLATLPPQMGMVLSLISIYDDNNNC